VWPTVDLKVNIRKTHPRELKRGGGELSVHSTKNSRPPEGAWFSCVNRN